MAYSLKNTLSESGDKIDEADKKTLEDKCSEIISWLDDNTTATEEEYSDKQKELEAVSNPIMQKLYAAGGAPGAAPGGAPGAAPGGAQDGPEEPIVEELD